MEVIKGSKITKTSAPYYTTLSNAYLRLEEFSANPGPPPETQTRNQTVLTKHQSAFKSKSARSLQNKLKHTWKKLMTTTSSTSKSTTPNMSAQ